MKRRPVVKGLLILGAVVGLGLLAHFSNQAAPGDLPANRVDITKRGEFRFIRANGIPDHDPGQFPNRHNPNRIREQSYEFRMPLRPRDAGRVTPDRGFVFAVAVNGVPFDPGTAEFWRDDPRSGWRYEAMGGSLNLGLDRHNAHVQPNGAYHYHGLPTGLIDRLRTKSSGRILLGYAADGYPLYAALDRDGGNGQRAVRSSYRKRPGRREDGPRGDYDGTFTRDYEYVNGSGDLDECNGRTGPTPEFPDGTYHYFVTKEFPFIPRMFRGTPDESFRKHGPPPGRRPPPKRGFPGREKGFE